MGTGHGAAPARFRNVKVGTAYKVYSAVYPALRAWTMLDQLIPFSEGYMMVAWGKKAA